MSEGARGQLAGVGIGGQEEGAAERAGGLALVDPLVDARLVEGVRAIAELADAVPRLERAQAHGAARGRGRGPSGGAAAPEVGVPDGGEARLDERGRGSRPSRQRRRRRRFRRLRLVPEVLQRRVGRVLVRRRRRGEAQRAEAEQDGVPEEVEQLQHQYERLRKDDAVAHRREPHGRPARTHGRL